MQPVLHTKRKPLFCLLFLLGNIFPAISIAQCDNWKISPTLITTSLCAANGGFNVVLSGADASNVTNLQYGIPITPGGFSVPLNNAATFSNIPPGTYTVSAIGKCNGQEVGKNTTVTIPGSYIQPTLVLTAQRSSLNCKSTGRIGVNIGNGRGPYTIKMVTYPGTYTGPTVFNSTFAGYTIDNLPPGFYSIQVTDACASGTAIKDITIDVLPVSNIPMRLGDPFAVSCNVLQLSKPNIQTASTPWYGYASDPSFKVSAQISGGIANATGLQDMDGGVFTIPLLPGKTLKDCYGKTITYTIVPPCGQSFTQTSTIPYPYLNSTVSHNCNIDFVAYLYLYGAICYPITYTLTNTATTAVYGPYTASSTSLVTPSLPIGTYTVKYTTADGYTGVGSVATYPITGNPYSIGVIDGSAGLHNYIEGFRISTNASMYNRTVELFNGPPGYTCTEGWSGSGSIVLRGNQTPFSSSSALFPPGNYVWKVTDACGVYYLPITVGQEYLYQFTAGISKQRQTCQGLLIWPSGTAVSNGYNKAVYFSILKNGNPLLDNMGKWIRYRPGDSVLLTSTGTYTIVPASAAYTSLYNPYPNAYTRTYTFDYTLQPLAVDMNQTQGFMCVGGTTGQGQIYVAGKDGTPFLNPSPYRYSLAAAGNGAIGPYIATNTTGVFFGFGGNANAVYDVKVQDACGAFAVQQVKILDLRTTRLISSDKYVGCNLGTIKLSAIYLPNATYAWTGPNGFSSNVREPVLNNISSANTGVYKVTIKTSNCLLFVSDSTTLVIAQNPPKPIISLNCNVPVTTTVTNPSPFYKYMWGIGVRLASSYYFITQPSDYGYSKEIYFAGSIRARAIDSTTGCFSESDSLLFADDPNEPLIATIYSPHLKICTGDSTVMVARGPMDGALEYQWFHNGVIIPGATAVTHSTDIPGNYKVCIKTGPCSVDRRGDRDVGDNSQRSYNCRQN